MAAESRAMSIVSEVASELEPDVGSSTAFSVNNCRVRVLCAIVNDSESDPIAGAHFGSGETIGSCILSKIGDKSFRAEGFQLDETSILLEQAELYAEEAKPAVTAFVKGFSSAVVLYGPSRGGKSHVLLSNLLPLSSSGKGIVKEQTPRSQASGRNGRTRSKEFSSELDPQAGLIPRAVADTLAFCKSQTGGSPLKLTISVQIASESEIFDLLSPNSSKSPKLLRREQQSDPSRGSASGFAWVPQDVERVQINSLSDFLTELLKADKKRRTQFKDLLLARVNFVTELMLVEEADVGKCYSRLIFIELASSEGFKEAIALEGDVRTSSVMDPTPSLFKNGSLLDPARAMRVCQAVDGTRRYIQKVSRACGAQLASTDTTVVIGQQMVPKSPNVLVCRILEYFLRGAGCNSEERLAPTFFFFTLCCKEGMSVDTAQRALQDVAKLKGMIYTPGLPVTVSSVDESTLLELRQRYKSLAKRAPSLVRIGVTGDLPNSKEARAGRSKSVDKLPGVPAKTSEGATTRAMEPKPPHLRGRVQTDLPPISPRESPKDYAGALPPIRPHQGSKSSPPTPRPIQKISKTEKASTPRPVILPPISPRGSKDVRSPASVTSPKPPATKAKKSSAMSEQPNPKTKMFAEDIKSAASFSASKEAASGSKFVLEENFLLLPLLFVISDIQEQIRNSNANGRFSDRELAQVQEWANLVDRVKLVAGRAVEAILCSFDPLLVPYLGSEAPQAHGGKYVCLWHATRNPNSPHIDSVSEALFSSIEECLSYEMRCGLEPHYCGELIGQHDCKSSTYSLLRSFYENNPPVHVVPATDELGACKLFKDAFANFLLEGDGSRGNRRLISALLIASSNQLIVSRSGGEPVSVREVCEDRYLISAAISDGSVDFVQPLLSQYTSSADHAQNLDIVDLVTCGMYQQQYRIPLVERLCEVIAGIPPILSLLEENKEVVAPVWQEFFHDICCAKKAINREKREKRISLLRKMILPPWKPWPFSAADLRLHEASSDGLDVLCRASRDNDIELLVLMRETLSNLAPSGSNDVLFDLSPTNLFEELLLSNMNGFTPLLLAVVHDSDRAVSYLVESVVAIFGRPIAASMIRLESENGSPLTLAKTLQKSHPIIQALKSCL